MSEQDKANDNLPKPDITRRAALTLAVAVATFGAAMGMRAPNAWAQGKVEGKEEDKKEGKEEGKKEGKEEGKRKNWWRRHRHRRHHHRHHDDD
jgi:hypothetical protein